MILRPYQVESIGDLREQFRQGHTKIVLAAPTGSGKSVMMLEIIQGAEKKGSRSLFICERRILVEQFSRHLDSIGVDHGVLMANHWRFRPHAKVQVASAQTLERMESWPAFDLVFIDELHACMRKSVVAMLKARPDLKVIGATATPFHPAIAEHFSAITSVISMSDLVDNGSLVPFRVFVAKEIDTLGVPVVAGEWKKDELEKRGQQIVGDIVTDYVRISQEVFGGYRKTICFSCGVAHGADLVRRFGEAGINAVQLTYKDDEEYKSQVLEDFAKADTEIQMLISADILTRGYDQTDVEHVILARPLKKSFSSHVQMVGRGARPHLGKKFCVIQDNAGNWLRFAESWGELYEHGAQSLESDADKKARKEPSDKEKTAAKCPRCSALWPAHSDTCAHCGLVRERKSSVVEVAGEMREIGARQKAEKYSPEYKRDFYAQLLGYALARGNNPGSAYYRYKAKFGVGPSMAKPEPKTPGLEVIQWVRSQNIAFAKSREKVAA